MTARSSHDQAGYDRDATARWVAEPPKRAAAAGFEPGRFGRGPFERDRARVLHTSALRRLAAKTQVVEVDAGDFPRTRLTHSLECAQIGRELGGALGCDPDLVDAACLAHDLGHPPFGHNGESALADVAAACGGFEGNAQSLRLLTRLEAKVPGAGLNLTRATLDATLKYPWLAGPGLPKYGAYADDAEVFGWIRDGAPPGRPCLEAQVMDWADDVAYSVHDLEDGLHAGLTRFSALADPGERKAISEVTADHYCAPGSVTLDELAEVFDDLLALPCWPDGFDGGPRSLAALKNLTSELIGRLCGAAHQATMDASGARPITRYDADLQVPRRQRLECALLKGVTAYYVMSRDGAAEMQARERELITELAAAVRIGAPGTIDPALRPAYETATSDVGRLRVVVDQVATLTDTSAVAWHARLCR
ncbi:MAG TPA: deoxyguanosinetriphosphate triphosphohydrolase [Streptosporangiaceae bacterium]|nr:deoxyguanosinetriphosphate triphosphohydrolase [Streptosporangiaceae bacterium]